MPPESRAREDPEPSGEGRDPRNTEQGWPSAIMPFVFLPSGGKIGPDRDLIIADAVEHLGAYSLRSAAQFDSAASGCDVDSVAGETKLGRGHEGNENRLDNDNLCASWHPAHSGGRRRFPSATI